jgi:general secretion pathway protein G
LITGGFTVGNSKGFTIIEILVVIVILGILGTLLVPKFLDKPDEARVTKATLDIKAISSSLKIYKLENGFYPTTDQGLEALIKQPDTEPVPKNYKKGGYLEESNIKDPWGNDFIYRSPGEDDRDFEIISYGADGKEGGEDFNADITSYK